MYIPAKDYNLQTKSSLESLEKKRQSEESRRVTDLKLAKSCTVADTFLNHTYLDFFSEGTIISSSIDLEGIEKKIRIYKIDKIVYDKNELINDKFISVYSALHNVDSSIAIIVKSTAVDIEFYMATFSEQKYNTAGTILQSSLKNNFPGIKISNELSEENSVQLFNSFMQDSLIASCITSVSMIPSERDDDKEKFIQGMEKFISSHIGKEFTVFLLAVPVSSESLQQRKIGYEELYSNLSPHSKVNMSFAHSETLSVNESISRSFTDSINNSISNTQGSSTSSSSGSNSGTSTSFGFTGNSWNAGVSDSSGAFSSYTSGSNFAHTVSSGTSKARTDAKNDGTGTAIGDTDTVSLTFENKSVQGLLSRADVELKRIGLAESYGMWDFCAYFISNDMATTIQVANLYKSIMIGNESSVERAHINTWLRSTKKEEIDKICNCLRALQHPIALLPTLENSESISVSPAQMISGKELPIVLSIPRKSLPGFAVMEMAEFGRSVVFESPLRVKRTIEMGSIYHMGECESSRVYLDVDLLASHCFITGSSGSGKSYATYQLIHNLLNNNIKMLVIEPAKGEYKHTFAKLKGLKIISTDPNEYRLLRINPFQFPQNMHVLAHIERLMQIFNASWSLYAAMPAILKDAVVKAYIRCGWDVMNSIYIGNKKNEKYPTFKTVLEILPQIINSSDYSADSKGDYKGALLTRVQSMTTGLTKLIFDKSEGISDHILFDSNAVVDLSDIGSEETIALLMGIIIMRLGEYRHSQRKKGLTQGSNSELVHVTILEEAHNLLKRTSKEQSQEGANIVGKSVEMIANSIKEMRTYGEGFVIIDQSPMAVDSSAIENTSTKIIFNTPAKDACDELASALSLNEFQAKELSRLSTGVATVFQKGWLTPVLMKVDEWQNPYTAEVVSVDFTELKSLRGNLISELYTQFNESKFYPQRFMEIVAKSSIDSEKKKDYSEIISNFSIELGSVPSAEEERNIWIGRYYMQFANCEGLFDVIKDERILSAREFRNLPQAVDPTSKAIEQQKYMFDWKNRFYNSIHHYISVKENISMEKILICILSFMADMYPGSEYEFIYEFSSVGVI